MKLNHNKRIIEIVKHLEWRLAEHVGGTEGDKWS